MDTAFKDEVDSALQKYKRLSDAHLALNESLMVVESRSKEESELLEKLARGQQRNAERLSSAELAQAHAKVEVDDRLNDLKTSFTDINRINFAHEGALEGVEHALEELKQQAASDTPSKISRRKLVVASRRSLP